MPALIGMIIDSAPMHLKAASNSMAYVLYNCLGYLPSPFLYGFVCNMTGGSSSRGGMYMLMMWTLLGNIMMLLALMSKDDEMGSEEQEPDEEEL